MSLKRVLDAEVALDTRRQRREFSTLSGIDCVEVIDGNGRTVAVRDDLQTANGVCFHLNNAASRGPKALVGALGRLR